MTSILFIDDDVLTLQLMSKASHMLGCRAIISDSPQAGLVLAEDEKPSLILVDLQMDEMNGDEFVRQLRHSPRASHVPVLIYSAGVGKPGEEKARRAGADGYLEKPLGLQQLSQIIRAYVR